MIKGYPKDSDLTIMNTMYIYPERSEDGKYTKGAMQLVVKDNDLNKKFVYVIENPSYTFYTVKNGVEVTHNEYFKDKKYLEPITVAYTDLEKEIAKITNSLDFYYDNLKSGRKYNNKTLHTHPKIFGSDMHIENYYRNRFNEYYTNNITPITKSFFDIEIDSYGMGLDIKYISENPGMVPVNAISYIDQNKNIHIFLLKNKNNPLIEEFVKELSTKEFYKELKAFITDAVGGEEKLDKYNLSNMKFQFYMFENHDELELIRSFFNTVNITQPDFILAWNIAFDLPQLINRISVLGGIPETIICGKEFKYKKAKYYIDDRNKDKLEERGDFATISSMSIWLDQMIQFASRRKGQSKFDSYKLDEIGEEIAKVRKLDFKHITTSIIELPYKDYKTFVFYNIMDTIVQNCIEASVNDIDYVFGKCIANNTKYDKVHRQTVYLTNRLYYECEQDGFIIGNNVNKFNIKSDEKFAGAFVADPTNISDYSKVKINGMPVNIFDNNIDFDFTRLYPSIAQEFNTAPNTLIGRIEINEKIHDFENRSNDDKFSRSGAFIEDLTADNVLDFCQRWFKLAGYEELCNDVIDFYTNHKTSTFSIKRSDKLIPLEKIPSALYIPFTFMQDGEKECDRVGVNKMNKDIIASIYKGIVRR